MPPPTTPRRGNDGGRKDPPFSGADSLGKLKNLHSASPSYVLRKRNRGDDSDVPRKINGRRNKKKSPHTESRDVVEAVPPVRLFLFV